MVTHAFISFNWFPTACHSYFAEVLYPHALTPLASSFFPAPSGSGYSSGLHRSFTRELFGRLAVGEKVIRDLAQIQSETCAGVCQDFQATLSWQAIERAEFSAVSCEPYSFRLLIIGFPFSYTFFAILYVNSNIVLLKPISDFLLLAFITKRTSKGEANHVKTGSVAQLVSAPIVSDCHNGTIGVLVQYVLMYSLWANP